MAEIKVPTVNLTQNQEYALVKHGEWIDQYGDGDWHCSECGAIVEKDEQTRHY